MNQKSITWIVVAIVAIVIIALGWWYFAGQSTTTSNNTTTTQQARSSQKAITSFSFARVTPVVKGTVDNTNYTVIATVPKGTNITKLTPTIAVSPSATVSPASGTVQDFTNPVTYTVTAQDRTTQTYTVTVTVPTDSIKVSSKAVVGKFLTDAKGMTLYCFTTDKKGSGKSACTGSCATLWPPFSTATITISTPLIASNFSTVTRADGQQQLAYKGWPLYYYSKDVNVGDVNGQGIGKTWYAVKP